jgi:acyl-CoA thioesterase-2
MPSQPAADRSPALNQLLDVLDVAAHGTASEAMPGTNVGDDLFAAASLHQPNGRVYGGQVLAQALVAARRTIDSDRLPHSLHGYFLRAGDLDVPIELAVERMRDGRSFSARRTHAIQHDRPILSMIASFQDRQEGLELTASAPEAPDPESVPSAMDVIGGLDHPYARHWSHESAFEMRHVGGSLYLQAPAERSRHQLVWMRARGTVGHDQFLHRALLLYACDQIMLEPVLRAAGLAWSSPHLSVASLDHAMWWHRDVQVDEWMLFEQSAASAQGGRGLTSARVFTRDGTLVASMSQEGMVRFPVAD